MALSKRCRVDSDDTEYEGSEIGDPTSVGGMGIGGGVSLAKGTDAGVGSKAGADDETGGSDVCGVLMLPNEVLASIMQRCSYTEVAEAQRNVCRRFAEVAALVLSAGLYRVGADLDRAMVGQEMAMESATTDNEMAVAARAFCALEFVRMQWRLVEATVWRHSALAMGLPTEGGARVCLHAGRLLDRLSELCRLASEDPVGLAWSFHYGSSNRSSSARHRLAGDTKRFLNAFEKYAERQLNRGPRACGAKLVDLLLCLEDEKSVETDWPSAGVDPDTGLFRLRCSATLHRAWFTCLRVESPADEHSPCERQRYMFLRLRRLVSACNEHTLERTHYEREALMRLHTPWRASVSLPCAAKYAAFGHYADEFFYYGALNERAYEERFLADPLLEILGAGAGAGAGAGQPADAGGGDPPDGVVNVDDADQRPALVMPYLPSMEVRIYVRLVCPPALAPLAALRRLQRGDFDPLALPTPASAGAKDGGPFALEMELHCAASAENRLPARYVWRVSDDDGDADGLWAA